LYALICRSKMGQAMQEKFQSNICATGHLLRKIYENMS
jgi:hypothetical protein